MPGYTLNVFKNVSRMHQKMQLWDQNGLFPITSYRLIKGLYAE